VAQPRSRSRIELLYFPGCPNVQAAREQLARALALAGLPPRWVEHDVSASDAPAHTRGYGSPTILVDGRDVAGGSPAEGSACRLYPGSEVAGVPPTRAILAALVAEPPRDGALGSRLAAVPAVLLSLLPVVGCPSCWPAYAAVLAALGVPFLMDDDHLLLLTALALTLALGGLGWRARRRRGFGPLAAGIVATVCILVGKFASDLPTVGHAGTALLVGSVLWNGWPRRARPLARSTG